MIIFIIITESKYKRILHELTDNINPKQDIPKEIPHKKKHKKVKNIMESSDEEPDLRVVSKKKCKVKVVKRKS